MEMCREISDSLLLIHPMIQKQSQGLIVMHNSAVWSIFCDFAHLFEQHIVNKYIANLLLVNEERIFNRDFPGILILSVKKT